jgi:hypothetical protein
LAGVLRVLRWLAEFAVAVLMVLLVFFLARRSLPKVAIARLSEMTNTTIETDDLHFDPNGSVLVRNLVIKPHTSTPYDNSILKAEEVLVKFRLGSLLLLSPQLKEVTVNGFVIRVQHDLDADTWNVSALDAALTTAKEGKKPRMTLENGKIQYAKVKDGRIRVAAEAPISARFRPAEEILGGYSFDMTTTPEQRFDSSMLVGNWTPGRIIVGGRLSSSDLPGFDRPWTINTINSTLQYDTTNKTYSLVAEVNDMEGPASPRRRLFAVDSPTLYEAIPVLKSLQAFFERYGPSGRVDMKLKAHGKYSDMSNSKISGSISCTNAAAMDSRFPYAADSITGTLDFTQNRIAFNNVTGRHGDVDIQVSGWMMDFGPDWKYQVQITSGNMLVDKDLYNALGPKARAFWDMFSPTGTVALNYTLSRFSQTSELTALAIELLSVDATYAGFPYPLTDSTGGLFFGPTEMVFSDVTSARNGHTITINGNIVSGADDRSLYDIVIDATDVAIDETLARCLPAGQRAFYDRFDMNGVFDGRIRVFTDDTTDGTATYVADITVKDTKLKAHSTPIELQNVTARAMITPEITQVQEFEGVYGGGTVSLMADFRAGSNSSELLYCANVIGTETSLDSNLISVLPSPINELLMELNPTGRISFRTTLNTDPDGACGPDELIVECLGNSIDSDMLPYPLKNVMGTIRVSKDSIVMEKLQAEAWHRVRGTVVPSRMRVEGTLALSNTAADPNSRAVSAGEIFLQAENLKVVGKSLAKVKANFTYEPVAEQWQSRELLADFYGGRLTGKLTLNASEQIPGGSFLFEAGFEDAELRRFLADTEDPESNEEDYSAGNMDGTLNLAGRISDGFIRLGKCRFEISDMQVGRLSPIANLLQVLNLTEPTDYAFDEMLVDGYIKDNRVLFREIDLSGESLAFEGSGWMDLADKKLNLTLTGRGQRLATAKPSVVASLTEGLGQAVVRIDVTGTADEPKITTTTLPVIKETFELLGTSPESPEE